MPVEIKAEDFDIEQTLECGQCFNFEKLDEKEYIVVFSGKMLHIKQEDNSLILHNASEEEAERIWKPYFDLDRDYAKIKTGVIQADDRMRPIIGEYSGIHILEQEFVETLISFIISQNKNIPHIKQIIRRISEEHGERIGSFNGRDYFSFPGLDELERISVEEFRELKTGFRAPYLRDAVDKLASGTIKEDVLREEGFEKAKADLTRIKGVGEKVANCVLLFGLGYRNAFPVDVWIKRVMEELYFGQDTDKKVIESFAAEKFGEYGGYAQQYLFIYARESGVK